MIALKKRDWHLPEKGNTDKYLNLIIEKITWHTKMIWFMQGQ